jgi:hypothetical protein
LVSAMPCALEGKAAIWWRFYKKTNKWVDFKEAFMKMFGPSDYFRQLRQELERRTQGPGESLTTFIATIHEYYEKLNSREPDEERVSRVIRQMHPSYKPYMWQKQFKDLHEMMEYAHDVQASLHLDKTYKPPPTPAESVDISLAYRPTRADMRSPTPPLMEYRPSRAEVFLPNQERARSSVRFSNEEPRSGSRERRDYSRERARQFEANSLIKSPRERENDRPRDRSRDRDNSSERRGRDSSRERTGACFICGNTNHWANNCPEKEKNGGRSSPSVDAQTKNLRSPSRQ